MSSIVFTLLNTKKTLQRRKRNYLETLKSLLEMILLTGVTVDGGSLVPLLKKSHLLNSNYAHNCLKFTIHLKTHQIEKSHRCMKCS